MKIIKYKFLSCEVNHGTEKAPDIEQIFLNKEISCSGSTLDSNYAIALAEAWNGEVTVEDVPDEEHTPTDTEVINTLLGVGE